MQGHHKVGDAWIADSPQMGEVTCFFEGGQAVFNPETRLWAYEGCDYRDLDEVKSVWQAKGERWEYP